MSACHLLNNHLLIQCSWKRQRQQPSSAWIPPQNFQIQLVVFRTWVSHSICLPGLLRPLTNCDSRSFPVPRIRHTIILDDPFDNPPELEAIIPPASPEPQFEEVRPSSVPGFQHLLQLGALFQHKCSCLAVYMAARGEEKFKYANNRSILSLYEKGQGGKLATLLAVSLLAL